MIKTFLENNNLLRKAIEMNCGKKNEMEIMPINMNDLKKSHENVCRSILLF